MFAGFSTEQQQWFADGMAANARNGARALLSVVDFSGFEHLLDVGGNAGGYAIPIAIEHPTIRITIVDLPDVESLAHRRIHESGLGSRVGFAAGSFFEPLGVSGDAILLSSILHDWEEEDCLRILGNCYEALAPGGTIVVTEPMLSDDYSGPDHPAASGLTMALLGGENRTRKQVGDLLQAAGFGDVWMTDVLPQNSVVTAKRTA